MDKVTKMRKVSEDVFIAPEDAERQGYRIDYTCPCGRRVAWIDIYALKTQGNAVIYGCLCGRIVSFKLGKA